MRGSASLRSDRSPATVAADHKESPCPLASEPLRDPPPGASWRRPSSRRSSVSASRCPPRPDRRPRRPSRCPRPPARTAARSRRARRGSSTAPSTSRRTTSPDSRSG
ncbi:hypothetical protein DZF97_07760 [Clavibacter nebraskensis]|uniref:Uncharacterized protein n=1 Tax=Clavibacter nebraskensis TaxID=31963 RepID=A0A399Q2H8_9MICO|nr:hypothetical protein DZF97_07760 [Clavibacter nebraskensis]UKF29216.1 hypothetical protein FGQ65_14010 [Clavibacter nebraskensis]